MVGREQRRQGVQQIVVETTKAGELHRRKRVSQDLLSVVPEGAVGDLLDSVDKRRRLWTGHHGEQGLARGNDSCRVIHQQMQEVRLIHVDYVITPWPLLSSRSSSVLLSSSSPPSSTPPVSTSQNSTMYVLPQSQSISENRTTCVLYGFSECFSTCTFIFSALHLFILTLSSLSQLLGSTLALEYMRAGNFRSLFPPPLLIPSLRICRAPWLNLPCIQLSLCPLSRRNPCHQH